MKCSGDRRILRDFRLIAIAMHTILVRREAESERARLLRLS